MSSGVAQDSSLAAVLIRGLIEQGVPDQTGQAYGLPAGALDLGDVLGVQRGAAGARLVFSGPWPDGSDLPEEFVFSLQVVSRPTQQTVAVRCAEALYYQEFGASPPEGVAPALVAHVRAHLASFVPWRASGGRVSLPERNAIPRVTGTPFPPGLVAFLEALYRQGSSLNAGPASGWWYVDKQALGAGIQMGRGEAGFTQRGPAVPKEVQAAHASLIQGLTWSGYAMMGVGALSLLSLLGNVSWIVYRVKSAGISGAWTGLLVMLASLLFSVSWVAAGNWLRQRKNRGAVRLLTILGMLPTCGACCSVGFPVGLVVFYFLTRPAIDEVYPEDL